MASDELFISKKVLLRVIVESLQELQDDRIDLSGLDFYWSIPNENLFDINSDFSKDAGIGSLRDDIEQLNDYSSDSIKGQVLDLPTVSNVLNAIFLKYRGY